MKESTPSTEERLREAARQVFLAKGYEGTTLRELAEAAGLNVAMTNYYFRSKMQLFKLTFADFNQQLFAQMSELLNRAIPLREKITLLIDTELELVEANPDLPLFVLYELQHNPSLLSSLTPPPHSLFFAQVTEAVASGLLPAMHPVQLVMLIVANTHHPYMTRTIMPRMLGMPDEAFATLLHRHKQTVREMLLGYLFGHDKQGA